jgi:glycosyltransferase involved in cell wall biosynthesis
MENSIPKISCIAPTYNNEKYIKFFIESILNQTETDFELIIVNDCSTDNTIREIQKFKDKRIKLIEHEYNKGYAAGLNTAFKVSKGKYIVFAPSDDIFEFNHFATVSNYLDTNPNIGAYYCSFLPIDENNQELKDYSSTLYTLNPNLNKIDILRGCFGVTPPPPFMEPGKTIRREIVEKQFPFPNSLSGLIEFKSHIDTVLLTDIIASSKRLVKYRLTGQSNTNLNLFNTRMYFEKDFIMNSFLQINNLQLLKKVFEKEIKQVAINVYHDTIPYFLGRMALLTNDSARKQWGYRTIFKFLESEQNSQIIYKKYKQTNKDLIDIIKIYKLQNGIFKFYLIDMLKKILGLKNFFLLRRMIKNILKFKLN